MFWIIVSLLMLLALAFLLVPLFRFKDEAEQNDRQQQNIDIAQEKKTILDEQLSSQQLDQDSYEKALVDLETSLAIDLEKSSKTSSNLQGKWLTVLFIPLICILSIVLYFQLGEYQVITNPELAAKREASPPRQLADNPGSLSEMIEIVKKRLREKPEDANGWFVLGKTYMSMQRFDDAVTAYQRTYELVPEEYSVMLSLADALAMQKDGNMLGEPEKLVKQALEKAPNDSTGLWLAGLAAEQGKRYREAYEYWTRLLPLIKEDPNSTAEVKNLLSNLIRRNPELEALVVETAITKPVDGPVLQLVVDLDSQFKTDVNQDALVFIYAKALKGPPMPLAARRMKVSDLPVEISLTDSDAMLPQMKLSGFEQVVVGARVSFSGNPVAQPGDIFAEVKPVDTRNPPEKIDLLMNQVKP